jgi:glycosyltransferase involved in cell wall biosynthesis
MKPTLTAHILTHNNSNTLEATLESLRPLHADIWVIDHDSTDDTIDVAKRHVAPGRIRRLGNAEARADARNALVLGSSTDWHFYLEPGEVLKAGHAAVLDATKKPPGCYRVFVSQSGLLTKPIRLWHKGAGLSFDGFAYESLFPDRKCDPLNVVVNATPDDKDDYLLTLIRRWRDAHPAAGEPYYYEAMVHLSKGRHAEFQRQAEHFLFRSKSLNMPVVMTRYYLAWANTFVLKNANQAFANLVVCLSVKPLHAEFWCLLGDIHYHLQHDFDKAYRFYDTAILMGAKRKTGDEWPVELAKYADYPKMMMTSCEAIKAQRKLILA